MYIKVKIIAINFHVLARRNLKFTNPFTKLGNIVEMFLLRIFFLNVGTSIALGITLYTDKIGTAKIDALCRHTSISLDIASLLIRV